MKNAAASETVSRAYDLQKAAPTRPRRGWLLRRARSDEEASALDRSGVLLTLDDFVEGVGNFDRYIRPNLKRRAHIQST